MPDPTDQQDDNTQPTLSSDDLETHPDYQSSAKTIASGAETSNAAQSGLASFLRPDPYHKFLYDYKHKFVPQVDPATGQPVNDANGQPVMTQSDWYVSPARRALQSFLTAARTGGVSLLAGDFDPMRALKFEQFKTDQQMQNENLGRAIQQKKEADLQQSRQARLNFQTQKEADAKNLSEKKYALSYGHTQTQERQADQRLILASQAEQDRQAGKDQSLALQSMGPALKAATNYVQAQHLAAGDDLKDPNIQNHMRVEIAQRLDEEQPKAHADAVWTRLGASGALDGKDITDLKQVQQAISDADLKPEDKAFMKGWIVTHPTPASTSAAGEKRANILIGGREYQGLNTETDQPQFVSGRQLNQGDNRQNIVPLATGVDVQARGSLMEDVQRITNQSVAMWKKIKDTQGGEISLPARAALSYIANNEDRGFLHQYLQSEILGKLPPNEQALVRTMGSLKEQAMILRSGQKTPSTESTRGAINSVLPIDGSVPNADYALKQLELLQGQLNMAKSAVPNLGKVTERQKKLTEVPEETPQIQWRRSKKTGEVQSSNDGGKSWQTRSAPK